MKAATVDSKEERERYREKSEMSKCIQPFPIVTLLTRD